MTAAAPGLPVRPPRTGLWLFPDSPAGQMVDALVGAERAGVGEVWLGDEGPARDPFTILAAAARATSRLLLGVGVTNPYVRHPAITAATMATVHELSGGRALLGLGPGGQLSLGPLGIRPVRPLTDCRRALAVMRGMLNGVAADGYEPPSHAFSAPDLPVYVGSRGERFNRWASEAADGVFLAGIAPTLMSEAVAWAQSVRPVSLAIYASACVDESELDLVRPRLVYAFADAPARLREIAGLGEGELRDAATALAGGDPAPASGLMRDEVLGLVLAWGERTIVERLVGLARAHQPVSIGLAVLGSDPVALVDRAAWLLSRAHKELS